MRVCVNSYLVCFGQKIVGIDLEKIDLFVDVEFFSPKSSYPCLLSVSLNALPKCPLEIKFPNLQKLFLKRTDHRDPIPIDTFNQKHCPNLISLTIILFPLSFPDDPQCFFPNLASFSMVCYVARPKILHFLPKTLLHLSISVLPNDLQFVKLLCVKFQHLQSLKIRFEHEESEFQV